MKVLLHFQSSQFRQCQYYHEVSSMVFIEPSCPICTTGTIGFRLCSNRLRMVLMCDECNSVWLDPATIQAENAHYPKPPNFVVPITVDCSISKPLSQWASRDEVDASHWSSFIHGEGKALDEH